MLKVSRLKWNVFDAALVFLQLLLRVWWSNSPNHISVATAIAFDTTTNNRFPPRLQEAISKGLLAQPRPNMYVLGTVHVGSASAEDVQLLIETLRPSTVVLEIPPLRLRRIRSRQNSYHPKQKKKDESQTEPPKPPGVITALRSFPTLAAAGWSKGGITGLIFSTAVVGSSLLKQSVTTANEEKTSSSSSSSLPRTNEFTAAIEAADNVGSLVVPADLEFEELIVAVKQSVSLFGWVTTGANVLGETLGLRPSDPIKRRRGETMIQWAERRRDIATSRASRIHGEEMAPDLSKVLVDERDARFAEACLKILEANASERSGRDDGGGSSDITVCIVGLVHLDGVVNRLRVQ